MVSYLLTRIQTDLGAFQNSVIRGIVMRIRYLFLSLTALAFASAIAVVPASASEVNVDLSNITITGANVCGASGTATCSVVINMTFNWDTTTDTFSSFSMSSSDDFGTFSLSDPEFEPQLEGGDLLVDVFDPAGDFIQIFTDGVILGTGNPDLFPTAGSYSLTGC
jgi:hypothetical protein